MKFGRDKLLYPWYQEIAAMPSALQTRDLGMRLEAICKEGLRTRTELEEYRGDLLRVENNICV